MAPLVEMRNIVKIYPNGVVANKGVDFEIEKGEIHAIVGENGAGKTTLMKILYGSEQPSSGEILINGELVVFKSPVDAMKKGVGMVHQNFMQIPSFTAAENVVLGLHVAWPSDLDINKRGACLALHCERLATVLTAR